MAVDPILELKAVSKSFKQGRDTTYALQDADFVIRPGQFIAIIGPSGSGKSTFLTIAGGLQTPSKGVVKIEGMKISKLSQKQLTEIRLNKIGFILQSSSLVPFLSVEKQLILLDKVTKKRSDQETIDKLLNDLGILDLKKKLPKDLSGGERQRVAIAKALYGDPKLILADEPTASLDTKKAYEVVELLAKETRNRNKATIMVTHDERLLKYCDKVYEMFDGKLKQKHLKKN